jgi:ABC-type dipeptide/oligopeptide/nickel transport system permease component
MCIVTVAGVLILVFLLTHLLPGNPAFAEAGQYSSPSVISEIKKQLGLNQPLDHQFVSYVKGIFSLNLGTSTTSGHGVASDLASRFPATAELALWSILVAIVIAVPLGIWAGMRPDTPSDWVTRTFATVGTSTPLFWLGLVLIYLFFYLLGVAPDPDGRLSAFTSPPPHITGMYTLDAILTANGSALLDALDHLWLPVMTLSLVVIAPLLKITRAATIDTLQTDYVRTARSLGLSTWQIIRSDVLRSVGVQLLTTTGIVLGYLLSGSILVEQVFNWPGIGQYAWNAMVSDDIVATEGFILLVAVIYVVLNFSIDVLYALIDPRIRFSKT